ncbi:MAG: hypothetical protein R3D52_00550 [Xanthobacteraceae bacterium]
MNGSAEGPAPMGAMDAPGNSARHFRRMVAFAAKATMIDNAEPRTSQSTTPTSFRQWCEDVLKPALLS